MMKLWWVVPIVYLGSKLSGQLIFAWDNVLEQKI